MSGAFGLATRARGKGRGSAAKESLSRDHHGRRQVLFRGGVRLRWKRKPAILETGDHPGVGNAALTSWEEANC